MKKILVYLIFVLFLSEIPKALAHQGSLFIDQPEILKNLKEEGFSLAAKLMQEEQKKLTFVKNLNNQDFYEKSSAYRYIVENLNEELAELMKTDFKLGPSMARSHRLFNKKWLKSPEASFDLVGIVLRPDRHAFHLDSCGELRFIYRLSYSTEKKGRLYSRLPMSFNLVYHMRGECHKAFSLWDGWSKNPLSLKEGFKQANTEFKSLELNMQSVRWPSTVRPDMGGYAEYILRVYHLKNDKLELATLENTPDVTLIKKNPLLKKELLNFVKDNLQKIDSGPIIIPEKFLNKRADSVALQGTHRLKNAPFTEIFKETDFSDLDYSKFEKIKSPHGLLRRLNDFSCVGCHQGRTIAGFHFLGKDEAQTAFGNSIFISASPHFLGEQKRRLDYLQALIEKKTNFPNIPFSVRANEEQGREGAHCGLGDPSFAAWNCEKGLKCLDLVEDSLVSKTGICQPSIPGIGSACQLGVMKHASSSHKDSIKDIKEIACAGAAFCEDVSVGFPSGMCAGLCSNLKTGETCGSIAILQSFNDCLSKGKEPFSECLKNNVNTRAMRKCSELEFCRDDYVCATTSKGEGACIPPYFLFQLRVDGHP